METKAFKYRKNWHQEIEKELNKYFDCVLFQPIVAIFREHGVGIQPSLQENSLPISEEEKTKSINKALLSFLTPSMFKKMKKPNIEAPYEALIKKVLIETDKTIGLMQDIPDYQMTQWRKVAKAYKKNINTYSKDFSLKEFERIRKIVQQHMYVDGRVETLAKKLGKRFGVNKRKSEFLARQETNLLITDVQKERYKDVGVNKFQWMKSASVKKDPYHVTLDGQIFSYENPPIINLSSGERGLPRQRYNCRCGMRPILD